MVDQISVMQQPERSSNTDIPIAGNCSNSSADGFWADWQLNLERLVLRMFVHDPLLQHDDFRFSVYTWFLDHNDHIVCTAPRLVHLTDDVEEWEATLLHAWRYHIGNTERAFIDMVHPTPPVAEVEEHVAHLIISQHQTTHLSILVAIEFLAQDLPSVLTRLALRVPPDCAVDSLSGLIPALQHISSHRLHWSVPDPSSTFRVLSARHGICISVTVDPPAEEVLHDTVSLMQSNVDPIGLPLQCSFTDEFLQAIDAAEEVARMEAPVGAISYDPRTIEAQPEAFQTLWNRLIESEMIRTDTGLTTWRVESWFLHHSVFTRCQTSRITLLSADFTTWRQALVDTWRNRLVTLDDLSFSLVHPLPEDAASNILAQLIVTQGVASDLRSSVLSVYDTDEDQDRMPHTFAIVLPSRINLPGLLAFLNFHSDCPPLDRRNQCTLWFGRIPITASIDVVVQAGYAFRLLISRGLIVQILDLLNMEVRQLREMLQRSIQQEIYVRPPDPAFLQLQSGDLSVVPPLQPDGRPEWILSLQQLFDRHHFVEDVDQGAMIHANVWYLNAHPNFHCSRPRRAMLRSESFMWRSELMSPWLDHVLRASPAEFQVVTGISPDAMDTGDEPSGLHVIMAQNIAADYRTVLVSIQGAARTRIPRRRFAHVFQAQLAIVELLRLALPEDHAHSSTIVQTGGYTYLIGDSMPLQHGDHLVIQIMEPPSDLTDMSSLQQISVTRHPRQCKPAAFTDPDDVAVSLPRADPPPRGLPLHDGETEWSFELGTQMRLHGEYSEWEDAFYMNVVTWHIHHNRYPVCNRPRRIRLFGHAVTWIADLRNAWLDRLDQAQPFSIHIVSPRPPQHSAERSVCHIILEQGRDAHQAAVVLTALLEGFTNDGIMQGAYSVDPRINLPTMIRTMEVAHFCIGRRCQAVFGTRIIPQDDWFDIRSGQSARLRVRQLRSEVQEDADVEALHFEDLALMQTNVPDFAFNVNAPVFHPEACSIYQQPEYIQDLHELWSTQAFAWEEEAKSAKFMTWYVAPGAGHSRCLFGRTLVLFEDYMQWDLQLRRTWVDRIDPIAEVTFVIVQPGPEPLEPQVTGHVILIQHSLPTMSSSLITIQDMAIQQGNSFRMVLTLPENVRQLDIQGVGYDRECFLLGAHCRISTAHMDVAEGMQISLRDGDCLYLHVNRAFLPPNWQPPIFPGSMIGNNLLQKRSVIAKTPPTRHEKAKPRQVCLVTWFLDAQTRICRTFRRDTVNENACLAKVAERLWTDKIHGRPCHTFAVTSMCSCLQGPQSLPEICMIVFVPEAINGAAVVLETVLQTGQGIEVEHVAALIDLRCSLEDLWPVVRGKPGLPASEATSGYVDGRITPLSQVLEPHSGQCISYWLSQAALAHAFTSIDFGGVIDAFEWLDAHLFLPRYDLPETWPFLPVSLAWTCDWWEPSMGGTVIRRRIYFDGSRVSDSNGSHAGAGIAAFVLVQGRWTFAGALSTSLAEDSTSYQAEALASILATKFAFDLLKLIEISGTPLSQVELTLCYDSLTAGYQASGRWHAFSEPRYGHLVRGLHKCIEQRFLISVQHQHVKAHSGEPGNELVDTLAHQAALGRPLHDLQEWIKTVSQSAFVEQIEWAWFLFRPDIQWKGRRHLWD